MEKERTEQAQQIFEETLAQALKLPSAQQLPHPREPVQVQLPDVERWLKNG